MARAARATDDIREIRQAADQLLRLATGAPAGEYQPSPAAADPDAAAAALRAFDVNQAAAAWQRYHSHPRAGALVRWAGAYLNPAAPGFADQALEALRQAAAGPTPEGAKPASPPGTDDWSTLPPAEQDLADREMLDFVFLIDLLNFGTWPDPEDVEAARQAGAAHGGVFGVTWAGRRQEGYAGLCAAVLRAAAAGVPVARPAFWLAADDRLLEAVFLGEAGAPGIPLLAERVALLRAAGRGLAEHGLTSYAEFVDRFARCGSLKVSGPGGMQLCACGTLPGRSGPPCAQALLRALQAGLPAACFAGDVAIYAPAPSGSDAVDWLDHVSPAPGETYFDGEHGQGPSFQVPLLKRAQILVADTWAAVSGRGPAAFVPASIQKLTMFADNRVPQALRHIGMLQIVAPPLEARLRRSAQAGPSSAGGAAGSASSASGYGAAYGRGAAFGRDAYLDAGSSAEIEIRAASVVAVDRLRAEMQQTLAQAAQHGRRSAPTVTALQIDYLLWEWAKRDAAAMADISTHRTRTTNY
ncbi:hypothetical protein H696_05246 [Fonticula alba]|uniref:Queuosine 5'-phosphate N-glycosylase/hydrolase n=1 Tax=Fonticula alba TaxID=691883 RepID=A0A058Z217_FONAL|nr:hypothetical protein H696_05246 [Fonticula alba]KCV68329.1 hypothetical protein H696_05246 [Fonticula alba]|eukprot:XP_009497383.1 hypothetical protein H696_05246 [Fonticula alba]